MATKELVTLEGKYRTACGYPVRIYAVQCGGVFSVHGAYLINNSWYLGMWLSGGDSSLDEIKHSLDLVDDVPDYASWPIDAKVLVWSDGNIDKIKRHFSGVHSSGKPSTFGNGESSWTQYEMLEIWDYAELAE